MYPLQLGFDNSNFFETSHATGVQDAAGYHAKQQATLVVICETA